MPRYISDNRAQALYVSGSLESLLPSNSVARLVWAALEQLDFGAFEAAYKNDETGRPALGPRRLAAVWILSLLRGSMSSLELARQCKRDLEFRWLLGDAPVKKSTLCDFRTKQTEALTDLSTQVLAALGRGNLLPGESMGVDGSVIRAASSCRAVRSRRRMEKQRDRLKEVIRQQLDEADGPEEKTAKSLEQKLNRLERALEEMDTLGRTEAEDCITVSEPEADRKKLKGAGFGPAHNVQVTADLDSGVIVYAEIVQQGNDEGQLAPQLKQAQQALDAALGEGAVTIQSAVADSGYHNRKQLADLEEDGIRCFVPEDRAKNRKPKDISDEFVASAFEYETDTDTMRCPAGQTLRRRKLNNDKTSVVYQALQAVCHGCPNKPQCCPHTKQGRSVNRPVQVELLNELAQRLETPEGHRMKTARWCVVEGVFARIKGLLGWTRCRTWGLKGAQAELKWHQLTHNLCLLAGIWQPMNLTAVTA
jgi:transposase